MKTWIYINNLIFTKPKHDNYDDDDITNETEHDNYDDDDDITNETELNILLHEMPLYYLMAFLGQIKYNDDIDTN
jgi:hypothetical protein